MTTTKGKERALDEADADVESEDSGEARLAEKQVRHVQRGEGGVSTP